MLSRFRRQSWTLVAITVATLVGLNMGTLGAQEQPLTAELKALIQVKSCRYNCEMLGTVLEMYATDNQGLFPRGLGELVPGYLKSIPTCPAAEKDTYSLSYQVSPDLDAYTISCKGRNHDAAGLGEDSPSYNSAGAFDEASSALSAAAEPEPSKPGWEPTTDEEVERTVLACVCYGNTRIIAEQLKAYAASHQGLFPRGLGELVPGYLKSIPTCPAAEKDTYSLSYLASAKGDDYAFYCQGTHHPLPFLGTDRPRMAPGAPREDDGLEECLELAKGLNVDMWRNMGLIVP